MTVCKPILNTHIQPPCIWAKSFICWPHLCCTHRCILMTGILLRTKHRYDKDNICEVGSPSLQFPQDSSMYSAKGQHPNQLCCIEALRVLCLSRGSSSLPQRPLLAVIIQGLCKYCTSRDIGTFLPLVSCIKIIKQQDNFVRYIKGKE